MTDPRWRNHLYVWCADCGATAYFHDAANCWFHVDDVARRPRCQHRGESIPNSSIRCHDLLDSGVGPHILIARNGERALCGGPNACPYCGIGVQLTYEQILHQVFLACDAQDYGIGVTTGEDANDRWIKITISKDDA